MGCFLCPRDNFVFRLAFRFCCCCCYLLLLLLPPPPLWWWWWWYWCRAGGERGQCAGDDEPRRCPGEVGRDHVRANEDKGERNRERERERERGLHDAGSCRLWDWVINGISLTRTDHQRSPLQKTIYRQYIAMTVGRRNFLALWYGLAGVL